MISSLKIKAVKDILVSKMVCKPIKISAHRIKK